MTMQTTTLPFQVSGASAQAQPPRNAAAGVRASDVQAHTSAQFGATLSREIAQRQAPPAASGTPGKPTPAPARSQAADKPAAQGPKTAAREPEKRQEAVSEAPSTTPSSAGAEATGSAQDADSAAAAATAAAEAASAPVTDMLAFMASLAQPIVAVAAPVVAEVAVAAGGGQQLTALESAFAKLETSVDVGAAPALATASAQEGDNAATGFALPTGVQSDTPLEAADLRALQQTAQAAVQADPKPLQGQARDAAAPAATPSVAEVEAPAPAITQLQAAAAKLDVANPAAVPADRIPARVGTQAWDNQVSQRIVYMVGKEQAATLTLNPPDLGPVQVVLSVSNEGTSVAFSSNELEVRQALENALPRLREMMSESGIALGNATVDAGTQQFTQEQRQAQDGERRNGHGGTRLGDGPATAANDTAPRTRTVAVGDSGLVDTFA